MRELSNKSDARESGLVGLPAYPWTARQLFSDLRAKLSQTEGKQLTYDRLAAITGRPKTTVYHWFDRFEHPHVLAFLCCLERLDPKQRHAYIEAHCRRLPSLNDPPLRQKSRELRQLLQEGRGLTVITGGSDFSRTWLVTAIGHTLRRSGELQRDLAGIDLHRPDQFVPVESLSYIDSAADPNQARQLVSDLWPKMLTSNAPFLLLNGVFSLIPALLPEILRCAARRHVILADAICPGLSDLKKTPTALVVTIATAGKSPGSFSLNFQRINPRRMAENRGVRPKPCSMG